MKKLLLIPVLLSMAMLSHSQFIHKIKADSVLITNDSCNTEMNLENSTKDTRFVGTRTVAAGKNIYNSEGALTGNCSLASCLTNR